MDSRNELIFWFDQPPHVSKGAFNYVSKHWGNKVIFIADHEFPEHRKLIGWDDGQYGAAEMVYLSKQENPDEYIKSIFEQYPNAVHVMNGFFSTIESKISPYVKKDNCKLAVHTERPFIVRKPETFRQICKNIWLPIKYKRKHHEYKNYVKALIPLGRRACDLFETAGWSEDTMFSFMYCPLLNKLPTQEPTVSTPLKFLYVGRFDKKRMKPLQKAIENLHVDTWHLDMVGGYGNYAEEMKAWIEAQKNVSFLGKWDSSIVGEKMQEYDVYLLASKADGWNAQLNEVVNSGMAAIVTDESVSDELISASNSGIVVSTSNWKEFANAMEKAINNPDLVRTWKKNAIAYRHRIQGDIVGEYFMDILDYTFFGKTDRPQCPWL